MTFESNFFFDQPVALEYFSPLDLICHLQTINSPASGHAFRRDNARPRQAGARPTSTNASKPSCCALRYNSTDNEHPNESENDDDGRSHKLLVASFRTPTVPQANEIRLSFK